MIVCEAREGMCAVVERVHGRSQLHLEVRRLVGVHPWKPFWAGGSGGGWIRLGLRVGVHGQRMQPRCQLVRRFHENRISAVTECERDITGDQRRGEEGHGRRRRTEPIREGMEISRG